MGSVFFLASRHPFPEWVSWDGMRASSSMFGGYCALDGWWCMRYPLLRSTCDKGPLRE